MTTTSEINNGDTIRHLVAVDDSTSKPVQAVVHHVLGADLNGGNWFVAKTTAGWWVLDDASNWYVVPKYEELWRNVYPDELGDWYPSIGAANTAALGDRLGIIHQRTDGSHHMMLDAKNPTHKGESTWA